MIKLLGRTCPIQKALDWTRTLEDIYASSEPTTLSTAHDIDDWAAQTPSFARLVTPIVECYAGRLLASIDALNEGRDTPIIRAASLHTSCVQSLIGGLQRMITPTLILKLNLHRLRDDLNGNTAEKRYQSFIKRLAIPAYALGLFQEYPVLARQIARLCEQWLASTIEFGHWIEDALSIEATFSPDRALGELVQLQCNLGDRHRDGRAVQIAEFSSGIRVVYKPRSLAVDLHFNALLEWVNERAGKAILRPLAVFDRGSHGWVEYVRAMDCPSLNLVDQYDECQGGLLALFYVLAGTDLHCDNIIACGSCPVVVDVETIFHPRLGAKARGCAAEGLAWSVVGTGLLPFPLRMREDAEPIDRSGLGAGQCEISPFALLCPEQAGTDQLHLVRKHLSIMPSSHRPTLKGTPVGRINGDRVLEGFRAVYTLLLKHRDELLSHGGPIARFLGDEVRIVLRNTVVYSRILSESYHPDVLRDLLDREQMFDRLWGNVPDSPHLAVVAAAETRDLLNGDVPYFTGRVGSRHLYTSDCKLIPDFLEDPSDAFVRKRVDSLGPTNLEQQAWLIEASLMTLPPDRVWIGSSPDPVFTSALSTGSLSLKLIALDASSIADRLETLSFSSGGEADWVSLKLRLKKNWSVTPCGPDLYEGLAGIVLFLAYLGAITKEQRYHDLACAGALRLKAQVESLRGSTHPIGAFVGWGGLIYTFSHLAELWQSAEFFERARTLLHEVERLIEEDHHYDVVAGAAGCLRCLLVMDRLDPSGLPLTLAARCGEYLVRSAKAMERGAGWANNPSSQPLTGFAHGAAGVFWALMALGDATGEARFCETAYRSLAYERDLFDDATGDWADLRANRDDRDHPPARMAAWCHGAAGIGLSRIEHFQKDGDNLTRIEIEAAVQATLSAGFGRNHSLCHGDLGNLDFLQQAAEALDREAWRLQLATRIEGLLDEMERCGPRCGIPKSLPIPGFMTGLAGIGFGLLRLATPQAVPCVLTLAPPPARRSDQSHPSANPDR